MLLLAIGAFQPYLTVSSKGWMFYAARPALSLLLATNFLLQLFCAWYIAHDWWRARRMGWRLTYADLLLRGMAITGTSRRIVSRNEAELLPQFDRERSDFENFLAIVPRRWT